MKIEKKQILYLKVPVHLRILDLIVELWSHMYVESMVTLISEA